MFFKKKRNIYAIGDVHGCKDELASLISKIPLDKHSTLVFLGDYIDRGPDSKGVIDLILALQKKYHIITLKGNHEQMFLDFFNYKGKTEAHSFILNGGSATLKNYMLKNGSLNIPDEHMEFFNNLSPYHLEEEYAFVHAAFPECSFDELDLEEDLMYMLWAREPFLNSTYQWEKTIIHGHTPIDKDEVDLNGNKINIDTSCVFDGVLTAIDLTNKKLIHSEKKVHHESIYLESDISTRRAKRFEGTFSVFIEKDSLMHQYHSLNFNEFGLLFTDTIKRDSPQFQIGDFISGNIGQDKMQQMKFNGKIVRVEEGEFYRYAIQFSGPVNYSF